ALLEQPGGDQIAALSLEEATSLTLSLPALLLSLYKLCTRNEAVLIASCANASHYDRIADLIANGTSEIRGARAGLKSDDFNELFEQAGFIETARADVTDSLLPAGSLLSLRGDTPISQWLQSVRQ